MASCNATLLSLSDQIMAAVHRVLLLHLANRERLPAENDVASLCEVLGVLVAKQDVTVVGVGKAIPKSISAVEIFKRKIGVYDERGIKISQNN